MVRILRVADYIHNHLRREIIGICGEEGILQWEFYKSGKSFKKGLAKFLDRIRWVIFFIPALFSFVLFYHLSGDLEVFLLSIYCFSSFTLAVLIFIIYPLEETEPFGLPVDIVKAIAKVNKLSDNERYELLLALSDEKRALWYVASAIVQNFDKLPKNITNLLFELIGEEKYNKILKEDAQIVEGEFSKVFEGEKAIQAVILALVKYFNKIPKKMRDNLLKKLIEYYN